MKSWVLNVPFPHAVAIVLAGGGLVAGTRYTRWQAERTRLAQSRMYDRIETHLQADGTPISGKWLADTEDNQPMVDALKDLHFRIASGDPMRTALTLGMQRRMLLESCLRLETICAERKDIPAAAELRETLQWWIRTLQPTIIEQARPLQTVRRKLRPPVAMLSDHEVSALMKRLEAAPLAPRQFRTALFLVAHAYMPSDLRALAEATFPRWKIDQAIRDKIELRRLTSEGTLEVRRRLDVDTQKKPARKKAGI